MVTSTGVSFRFGSETTRISWTLPISTPFNRTGAPWRNPLALSKYDRRMILGVKRPPVLLMRKTRTARVMLANSTVSPTLSWDHFNCFWLGTFSPEQRRHERLSVVDSERDDP